MEVTKSTIRDTKYVRIKLKKNEYVNALNCVEAKLLNPLPKDEKVDIGNSLYIIFEDNIAKKLCQMILKTKRRRRRK